MGEKQQSAHAWIGTPPRSLERLASRGVRFDDSDDFLLSAEPFEHRLYVVDLQQRGVPGADLVRLIRRRSQAGLVALSAAPHAQFVQVLESGADCMVDRLAPAAHVEAVIAALRRRLEMAAAPSGPWKLKQEQARLQAPDGTEIMLSRSDVTLLSAFVQAEGGVVARADITRSLWGPEATDMDGALHAALYRLRKKVEQAGQTAWPAHAVAGVGYEFRAPLLLG
ncbi:hypothetical protein GT347_04055 [Xylophilus rhododendri]|uniref:OmpR/PhoB-type domain-containing protein n=1 Tax=Xylophilus rhododendri TaxID=2697032 RepID=A0A857J1W1_9BURK|nr:winged helix-turn-helix domain-containing protein [Xylophilus rhododendri]QHI97223.1 hypothetical protein GT347_04055 [Xylophilus rhododendri]